ncbi:MAG: hypothetical protein U9P11_07370 [Pseudomonadota bacterium]|nr:hypothetical protein [Pseudomonadota bacterium]
MDKSQYFYRIAVFSMQEDKVSLLDANDLSAKTSPLEPWLGLVVSLADGQHTLQQLIEHLAGQYGGAPPRELERTIESVIERLTETDVIKLADQAVTLPYYLSLPAEKLDMEMAKRLMTDDGYLQNNGKH